MPTYNTINSNNDEKHQIKDSYDRRVVLIMGMGLNGISAEGWIPPAETKVQAEEMIEDVWTLLQSVDTLISGRVTFQMWETYWPMRALDPQSSEFQKKFSIFTDNIQKIVFSTTLKSVNWRNSRVVNDDIDTELSRIRKLPSKDIAVVGGAGIAQTFTRLELVGLDGLMVRGLRNVLMHVLLCVIVLLLVAVGAHQLSRPWKARSVKSFLVVGVDLNM